MGVGSRGETCILRSCCPRDAGFRVLEPQSFLLPGNRHLQAQPLL